MTKEEIEEYKANVALFVDSAQYEYRQNHPSCLYCECITKGYWESDRVCQVKNLKFNIAWDSDVKKMKRKARFCKYYFPKTDLS